MEHRCVVLSGLSGSGKTTLGQAYAAQHGWCFIDGDSFFLEQKPRVKLSDGSLVSNWDDVRSIDWDALNAAVKIQLRHSDVILATFMPRLDLMKFPVYRHIRLSMSDDELEKCLQARRKSKNYNTAEKIARDEMMVREYVYPVYLEMSRHPCDGVILTHYHNSRKTLPLLLMELDFQLA